MSTPLELLFDLVFAIWWAWLNYTWFASAYAVDDVLFRLLTFVIMGGALTLAAGVPGFFADGQSGVLVAGYAIMRVGMAALWLRAARHDPQRRSIALTYAVGILLVQLLWIARLLVVDPTWVVVTFLVGVVLELSVPFVAERRAHTPFHPEHVAERYGLLTIIVLGEVVLATVLATQTALAGGGGGEGRSPGLVLLVVGAFLVVLSLWWLYFRREHVDLVEHRHGVWVFGYSHYLVYASVAAVGAALAAAVEVATHDAHVSAQAVGWLLAGAIVVYLLTLGGLHLLGGDPVARCLAPGLVVAVLVLAVAAVGPAMSVEVLLMGVALVVGVALHHVLGQRAARGT